VNIKTVYVQLSLSRFMVYGMLCLH
jgi:hypothetical protein